MPGVKDQSAAKKKVLSTPGAHHAQQGRSFNLESCSECGVVPSYFLVAYDFGIPSCILRVLGDCQLPPLKFVSDMASHQHPWFPVPLALVAGLEVS